MRSNSLKSIFLFNLVLCCSMCIHHINQNFEFFLWCFDVDFVRVEGYSRGFGVWGSGGLNPLYIYYFFIFFGKKFINNSNTHAPR